MKLTNEVATLNILNKNSDSNIYPSYDHIELTFNKTYPVTNLDEKYIKQLIKELYPKDYRETYYKFTVRVTGKIILTDGQMPNPTMKIHTIYIKELKYIP